MKKSKIKLCLMILLIVLLSSISINSYAASFSITSGISTIEEGKTYTISIKASGLTGKFNITHSSNVSVSCDSIWVENGVADGTIKVTAKSAGKGTVTVSPESVADAKGNLVSLSSKTDTVTVKEKEKASSNSGSSNNNSGSSNSKPTKPTFQSRNETVYATGDVNVRTSYSTSSSVITTLHKGDSVTRTGRATEYINGVLWSKVTYNGQTAYMSSDLLTTTKPVADKKNEDKKEDEKKDEEKDKKSDNKNLKSLTVTPEGLSPKFSASVTEYAMSVEDTTKKVDIEAIPEDEKAKVSISGNTDLEVGENTVEIKVTAEDGTTKTYKIIVTKEEKGQLKLKELLIEGLPLQPEFQSDIYEYTLSLEKNNITELNITATPNKEDTEVEIVGNADLKVGANIITILLKSKDGEENATYQVTVNIPEKAAGIMGEKSDLYMYAGIFAAVIILIIIVIVAVKRHKKNKENDFSDYYGENNRLKNSLSEEENFNSLKELKQETKLDEVNDLPKLEEDDLPKSLRKSKKEAEKIEEDRSKKLDDLYAADSDTTQTRKRGKHF